MRYVSQLVRVMSASRRWKVLSAVVLIAVTIAGAGLYMFWNTPVPSRTVTLTPTAMSTFSATQATAMTTSTATSTASVSRPPAQWITVGEVKTIDYYLSILESKGTQAYAQLAKELGRLPDLKNATAVAKITYSALNATNPEVKEAFELMMKDGTPDPRDFAYSVPRYNTELQVLYRLALENEFKKDDTLALAIAMVNGLWITMGTDEVKQVVYKDTGDLLNFFRETNEIQKARGYHSLQEYPLEAKVALAWTGGLSMHWIGPLAQPRIPLRLMYYKDRRLPLIVYEKDAVALPTLRNMSRIADRRGWWVKDCYGSVAHVEDFFYFSGYRQNWEFVSSPQLNLDDNGLDVQGDVDWQFNRFVQGKAPRGDCWTESSWVDAWAKSMGIATVLNWMYRLGQPIGSKSWWSHHYAIYFDPSRRVWTAYRDQLLSLVPTDPQYKEYEIRYFVFRPPVDQRGYLDYRIDWNGDVPDYYYKELAYCFTTIAFGQAQAMMLAGAQTTEMKEWLFYTGSLES
jgi:hypothetical protein